ncbi:ABC transporter permease subunit [Streptomyces sp. NPDC090088]|uniref:ABC transporter permease subunit n=1 Tax=Streptomyces sp. NPDC090088 TaxID=3365944 RepID=UPI0038098064
MTATVDTGTAVDAAERDGFARLLRAEWTKFRTVPAWRLGLAAAVLVTLVFGVLAAAASKSVCDAAPGRTCTSPAETVGPDGEQVLDKFTLVHKSLTGDGGIVARVTSLTGIITYPRSDSDAIVPGVEPWSKAGIIIKDGTTPGSRYAAVMVTGGHGVRMQYDYTHDTAGSPHTLVSASSPRWLRLTRSGATLTGAESDDGSRWTTVGTATLPELPATVEVGLFVTSPFDVQIEQGLGSGSARHFTQASGVFDQVGLRGRESGSWRGDTVGGASDTDWDRHHRAAGFTRSGGTFTVTGSGDIAPRPDPGTQIQRALIGGFAGLIPMIVVATLFITSEYRRPLIRTTLAAHPRRGRVLAAKALVTGAVTFAAGLLAAGLAVPVSSRILRANGARIPPLTALTTAQVIAGTAGVLALTAVLALALGALLRRSAAVVTAVVVAVVLPYFLAVTSAVPTAAAQWLLRVTPAAAFAVQQTAPQYPQVDGPYTPSNGYFPLAPWAGFTVLCGYAVLALGLAVHRLRRRDA